MNNELPFSILEGFKSSQREMAVSLFWHAFKGKLGTVMNPETKAKKFLEQVVDPAHSISASAPDGTLLGIAGFKTSEGSFIGGDLAELQAEYGWVGGLWRGFVLSILERPVIPNTLLMDGIIVSEAARGHGIGTALLTAVKTLAAQKGCQRVRLDVIDINPRARALYERQGFVAQETNSIGPLRYVFGFQSSTTMVCDV